MPLLGLAAFLETACILPPLLLLLLLFVTWCCTRDGMSFVLNPVKEMLLPCCESRVTGLAWSHPPAFVVAAITAASDRRRGLSGAAGEAHS